MGNAYYQSQQSICRNTSLIQSYYTLNVIQKIKAEEETNNIRDISNNNNVVVGRGGGRRSVIATLIDGPKGPCKFLPCC
jgi:hypothetical protein